MIIRGSVYFFYNIYFNKKLQLFQQIYLVFGYDVGMSVLIGVSLNNALYAPNDWLLEGV